MRAAERLAQLLPGSVDAERVAVAVSSLGGLELAGALAGLTKPQELALRAAYLDDASSRQRLRHWLHAETAKIAVERNWRPPRGSRIFAELADLAVVDVCLAPRCAWCQGAAELRTGDHVVRCDACNGSGVYRVDVQAQLRCGPEWADRYHVVRHALAAWLADATHHVAKRLDR